MEHVLQLDYPGLIIETLPSGNKRCRVRVAGNPKKRITLTVDPSHKQFTEAYHAARRGIQFVPDLEPVDTAIENSISWLTYKYEAHLRESVESGLASQLTLDDRSRLFQRLRTRSGEYSIDMPAHEVVKIRDEMTATPAYADNMVKAIRAMYKWAVSVGYVDINPAIGIAKIDKGKGGAVAWTVEDLKQYRDRHPKGTPAHLTLTLFMFTACRIGDAIRIGRNNERMVDGIRALGWQPAKKGSAYVDIPMLPPLIEATRAVTVAGPNLPYILKRNGQPYAAGDNLGQTFRKWCKQAELKNRSSHGIRKAAGHLLAQNGCTQYQIMCIHGHTQAKTSEIYTKGIERWNMAKEAMDRLSGMEW